MIADEKKGGGEKPGWPVLVEAGVQWEHYYIRVVSL